MGNYLSALNTSMYQPSVNYNQAFQTNYNNFGTSGLNTGFSLENYTNFSSPSVFSGQSINFGGGYSPMAHQAQPPQQDNSSAFMQQLVLLLLTAVLQKRNQGGTTTTTEETIIDDTDDTATGHRAHHDHPTDQAEAAKPKVSTVDKVANVAGQIAAAPVKIGVEVAKAPIKAIGKIFKGW